MKPTSKILGLAVACAACCALPSVIPMLTAAGIASVGLATAGWTAAGFSVLAIGIAVAVRRRRGAAAAACSTNRAIGNIR
jgi:hypothetical protein